MASFLYDSGKEALLSGSIDLTSDTIKVCVVDEADYTPSASTDDYLDDVTAAGIVATSAAITGVTVTDGTFDCDDIPISAVTGHQSESVVFYKDTGNAATSPLICKVDLSAAYTPDGSDVVLTISASGVFAI